MLLLVMPPGLAQAALTRMTVLTGDNGAASAEFVRQLRETQAPGSQMQVFRLPADGTAVAAAPAAPAQEEQAANAGVRTRGLRSGGSSGDALTVAVGPDAARSAIDSDSREPLLLAMLSRLEFESLRASPGMRREGRRVAVLLRDPSMADQLALIDAALPQRRRLGVVATPESEPLLAELERAAGKQWTLQVSTAPDTKSIAPALRGVISGSDALMVLPDSIGDDQAATLAVLHAAAGAGLPVFGASEGMVRSGGLAAAVSTPAQLALQAQALGQKLAAGPAGVMVEAAHPASVRVNQNVARGLGLRLPDERELSDRVAAPR
ncbi:ABC transporter substrate binding protein [Variovorax sp. OV329]|uniref:ABC transporter substrate binding protein n=1 Tax=Variovorax sp. OV329 TaxID=1882825 RepID=UPI0020C8CB4D|nr:ABC transporter substrate binding protein [Variovorax sp. OV329]